LTASDYKKIILESKTSILQKEINRFMYEGIKLTVDEQVIDYWSKMVKEKKLGARGVENVVQNTLNNVAYLYFGKDEIEAIHLSLGKDGKYVYETIKREQLSVNQNG
jgi:ATP-dependent protease Clp ATPase subunit